MSDTKSPTINIGSSPKISIVVPTYNRMDTIQSTLESLVSQNYPSNLFEIIVVDNGSSDETHEKVLDIGKKFPSHQIRYFYESRPGVHFARNQGAKIAAYDLLYYTDDDIVADQNMLSEIIKPFLLDRRVGCTTGRVLPIWQVPPPEWIVKHCYNSLLSILDIPQDLIIAPHLDYIYSCHMAITKNVLFAAGGFNPENTNGNWIGDGETGLVIKVEKLGHHFAFNGASVVRHLIPESRMTQRYLMKRMGNSGISYAFTYYRKNRPSSLALIGEMFLLIFVKLTVRIVECLSKSIWFRDINYLRFIPGYCTYYFRRSVYNFRLVLNRNLRTFVLRNDWIND